MSAAPQTPITVRDAEVVTGSNLLWEDDPSLLTKR
jgi:hypothetical protein